MFNIIPRRLLSSSLLSHKITNSLKFTGYESHKIPVYQVMDHEGVIRNSEAEGKVPSSMLFSMFKKMIELRTFENIMNDSQRQGRISFFMRSFGEEACTIGSGASLSPEDHIYLQYREAGAIFWRGYTLKNMVDQAFGNVNDACKGRQMPMHYGSKNLKIFSTSSPLATQVPQAVGSAYALKLQKEKACVACYFGDGASSEGDSQVAFNMAQTIKCPVLFLCRNNQYAISTPVKNQFGVDGPADTALGHGITSVRVDGSDIFAVMDAVSKARNYCVEQSLPVFVEFVLYRFGDHSTSDDSNAYRDKNELDEASRILDPVAKLRKYLTQKGLWTAEEEKKLIEEITQNVYTYLKEGEATKLYPIKNALLDVYDEMPARISKQQSDILDHLNKYKAEYNVSKYALK